MMDMLKSIYDGILFTLKLWLIFVASLGFLLLTEQIDPDQGPLTRTLLHAFGDQPVGFCPVVNISVEDGSCIKLSESPPSMIITSYLPDSNPPSSPLNYESSKVNSLLGQIIGFDEVTSP